MNIGFIGLGRMGFPMAENLIKAGHTVVAHNRSRGPVDRLVAQGARAASSPAEVADSSDIIVTCLLTPDQVVEVLLGANGVASRSRAGQIVIDTSTIDPGTTRKIARALAEKQVDFIDAPVSGGPKGAQAGTLSVIIGGEVAVIDRARAVQEVFGKKLFHMGPAGAGVAAKVCNQILTGTQHALVAETMVLGTKLGLDPQRLFEVIKASSGQSTALERAVPNFMLPRNFEAAFAIDGIIKDLECAIRAAKESGVRLLLPTIAQQLFQEASGLGHGQKDVAAVVLPMEAIAGVQVKGQPR